MSTSATKFSAWLVWLFPLILSACAEVKEAGRTIGHTTRDVTREIGHGTRDVTREIGHGSRRAVKAVGQGVKDTAKSLSGDGE
ncbi:MAG: hypothetical protein ACU841_12850 [Gammaproteobacteria bacterium]